MDYTVLGILQARILEWVAFPFSRGSSEPRDWTQVSHIARGFFTSWATNSVQLLSRVRLFVTPWIAARQASLSITNSQSLHKLMSIKLVMPSSHLILCPLLLLPPIPSSIRVFSNESALHMRWPKYCSFSFSISPSNELPGLISFRMFWLDLLEVQGTLKSLLQRHSSKASIFQRSAFFTVQLSHPYMTTGKTIALTKRTCLSRRRVIMVARCQSGKATWKNVRWLSFKSYKGSFGVTDFFFFFQWLFLHPYPINNVFYITLYPLLKQHFMEWSIHFPPSWSVLEKVEILLGLYCESNAFCHQEKVELIKLCENRAPENDLLKSADVCR